MIASIKFLVPFSLLTRIGEHWSKPVFTKPGAPAVYSIIEEFSMPFRHLPATGSGRVAAYSMHADLSSIACALIAGVWVCGCFVVLVRWISAWRRTAVLAREAEAISEGREFDALRRAERRTNIGRPIALAFSSREIEPGVFGVIRPVLLWPIGLSDRLDDAQIDAIMVHEVEHVRRRDNLTTAIHAAVEALFWFHPLVRWMTARLNEERERACDESVIERNAKPEVYADSILKVCAFCLEPRDSVCFRRFRCRFERAHPAHHDETVWSCSRPWAQVGVGCRCGAGCFDAGGLWCPSRTRSTVTHGDRIATVRIGAGPSEVRSGDGQTSTRE